MAGGKRKFYVVWRGREPGIYSSWDECRKQTRGFKGAEYKACPTLEEARAAFAAGPEKRQGGVTASPAAHNRRKSGQEENARPLFPLGAEEKAVAVDAACSGNPGAMEYRGVCLNTGRQLFHFGPCYGTNNIGEFLAIVHALALIRNSGTRSVVYSDSRNAILWVKRKKCKTTLAYDEKHDKLFKIIGRAEKWLRDNPCDIPVLKWETAEWGEIPADFGRKNRTLWK